MSLFWVNLDGVCALRADGKMRTACGAAGACDICTCSEEERRRRLPDAFLNPSSSTLAARSSTDRPLPSLMQAMRRSSSDSLTTPDGDYLTGDVVPAYSDEAVLFTAEPSTWTVSPDEEDIARETEDGGRPVWVDLAKTVEGYTGYDGSRAWAAIYGQNCFADVDCNDGVDDERCRDDAILAHPDDDESSFGWEGRTCTERHALWRLISGLHSSITMHLVQQPVTNLTRWVERFQGRPQYVDNLRFTLVVLTSALSRAKEQLQPLLGSVTAEAAAVTKDLFATPLLCAPDVGKELLGISHESAVEPLRRAFADIAGLMNCLECEKCRVFGKLQFEGLSQALRILTTDQDPADLNLRFTQAQALLYTTRQVSNSLRWFGQAASAMRAVLKNPDLDPEAAAAWRRGGVSAVPTAGMAGPMGGEELFPLPW